jgi:hypothetical protein
MYFYQKKKQKKQNKNKNKNKKQWIFLLGESILFGGRSIIVTAPHCTQVRSGNLASLQWTTLYSTNTHNGHDIQKSFHLWKLYLNVSVYLHIKRCNTRA